MIAIGAGLACPRCGGFKSEVKDSRAFHDGIRRRRLCVEACARKTRYTTIEVIIGGDFQGETMNAVTRSINLLAKIDEMPAHKREIVLSLVAAFAADEVKP